MAFWAICTMGDELISFSKKEERDSFLKEEGFLDEDLYPRKKYEILVGEEKRHWLWRLKRNEPWDDFLSAEKAERKGKSGRVYTFLSYYHG